MVIERTYVPLRFIAEAFGAKVQWISADRLVKITMDGLSSDSGSDSNVGGGTGGTDGTVTEYDPTKMPDIPIVLMQNHTYNVPTIEEMAEALEPITMAGGYTRKVVTSNEVLFSLSDRSDLFDYAVGGGRVQLIFSNTHTGDQALAVF